MPCEGGLAEVAMSPELDGVEWQRYVPLSSGRYVDWNKRLDPEVAHELDGSVRIFFRGSFSSEFGKAALYLSLESADRYAERLIRTVCRQMGIEWTGRLLSRATVESPAWRLNYEPVSRVLSAPLPEIVRSINKDSLNAAAQSLFLALSDEHTNTASAVVVKRWLLENGIYCAHLRLPSGSGSTRRRASMPYSWATCLLVLIRCGTVHLMILRGGMPSLKVCRLLASTAPCADEDCPGCGRA